MSGRCLPGQGLNMLKREENFKKLAPNKGVETKILYSFIVRTVIIYSGKFVCLNVGPCSASRHPYQGDNDDPHKKLSH